MGEYSYEYATRPITLATRASPRSKRRSHRRSARMERPLLDFDKNFYYEHPAVTAWSDADVRAWRRDRRVSVRDDRTPKPVRTFMEAAFPDYLVEALEASDFPRPTVIQSQGWPIILSGHDCIGLASTGSGKTLAFTLPAIVHIIAQDYLAAGDGPIALMLAPTRELALQIKAECDKFGASSGVKNTCVYGGVPKGPQLRDLQHGVEIAIATPGRLLDFLDAGQTNMRRTTCEPHPNAARVSTPHRARRVLTAHCAPAATAHTSPHQFISTTNA